MQSTPLPGSCQGMLLKNVVSWAQAVMQRDLSYASFLVAILASAISIKGQWNQWWNDRIEQPDQGPSDPFNLHKFMHT
jgi:hypothetical protein